MIRRLPIIPAVSARLAAITISLAVLLIVALVALSGSTMLTLLGLGVIGLGMVILLLLRWPALGPILLIPIAFFVPYSIGTGTHSEISAPFVWAMGIILLWIATIIADPTRRPSHLTRPQIALLVLSAIFIVALFVGQGNWMPLAGKAPLTAQLGGLALVLLSVGVFFVTAEQMQEERGLIALVGVFLLLGGVFAVGVLIPPLKPYLLRLYEPGSISSQCFAWLPALALGQAVFNRRLHPILRISLAGLSAIALYSVYVSVPGWVSGWLPALVGVLVIIVLRSRWTFLVILGGGLLFAPQALQSVLSADAYSYTTRMQAWQILVEIIKANPILGLGPANYYWYTPLFPISGYYGLQFNSHNQYVDLVAQAGILGFVAYLWFLVSMGLFSWQAGRRAPEGFARGYIYGAIGGLATIVVAGMFGDWILPFVYNVGLVGFKSSYLGWLFLGGVIAMVRIMDREA